MSAAISESRETDENSSNKENENVNAEYVISTVPKAPIFPNKSTESYGLSLSSLKQSNKKENNFNNFNTTEGSSNIKTTVSTVIKSPFETESVTSSDITNLSNNDAPDTSVSLKKCNQNSSETLRVRGHPQPDFQIQNFEKLKQDYENIVKRLKRSEEERKREKRERIKEKTKYNKELKRLQSKSYYLERVKQDFSHIFTGKQVEKAINKNKKKVMWDMETIASCMSLRSISPKGYRHLYKKNFPLPSFSTIRKYAAPLDLTEGILYDVLRMMKESGSAKQDFEKLLVLSFDEMYTSQQIEIDRQFEQVVGPHKTVQVGMARGLFSNWKQPIYYKFDQTLTKDILEEVISKLYDNGYTVVAVVTDLGGNNGQAFKSYNLGYGDMQNRFFKHPSKEDLKVFVFADTPHLIKLVRNHFLDTGYIFREVTVDGEIKTKEVKKEVVEEVMRLHENCELRVAFKLKQEHIDVQGAKRQKVCTATKLLSNTTAQAIRWCGENGLLSSKDWQPTYELFKLFNDWFDLFNAKTQFEAYGKNLQAQDSLLSKVIAKVKQMKFKTPKGNLRKALFPFQTGIILNCMALQEMLPCMQKSFNSNNFKITYILTNKLNQDCLENLFAHLRAQGATNDHPTALNFKYRLKWYLLGSASNIILSDRTNAIADNAPLMITLDHNIQSLNNSGFPENIGDHHYITALPNGEMHDAGMTEKF